MSHSRSLAADQQTVVITDTPRLHGFRIGVTSDRRSAELIGALERRGAEVFHAPTLRIVPASEDSVLVAASREIIADPPAVLLATTAHGIRGWFESTEAAGIGAQTLSVLGRSTILVRGPKARGAIRAAGLTDQGMSAEETTASLVDHLLTIGVQDRAAGDLAGLTVAVQLHGFVDEVQLDRLRSAGATLRTVAPYRWSSPDDPGRVAALLDQLLSGDIDAVTFTSAPAAQGLLAAADERGQRSELIAAFQRRVLAAAVGPVTAEPLISAGLVPIFPERFRLGALIRLVCEVLENQRPKRDHTG